MRLINTETYELENFNDPQRIPEYAILSHTWSDKGEVCFNDIIGSLCEAQGKPGWPKIQHTCTLARAINIGWAWIDTCCIDKSKHSELEREINSMFDYYANAVVCFAFLEDLHPADRWNDRAPKCRWFKRGWTLQELVAPRDLVFLDSSWQERGSKHERGASLLDTTGVDVGVLKHRDAEELRELLDALPVAKRMSWAAGRKTTEVEDRAYSLLGIFGITNMEVTYGRGDAFRRLVSPTL